jgi:septal ring factor EnvC (AmiA/AmiB activator)
MKSAAWDGDWPITQEFGENAEYYNRLFGLWGGHNGVDVGCPIGTVLRAPEPGRVVEVSSDPLGYGLTAYVQGDSGRGYRYGHGSYLAVRQGDLVEAGQIVALSGNSGNSTGPHLHFGIRPPAPDYSTGTSGYVDPLPQLAALEAEVPDEERQQLLGQIDQLNGVNTELGKQVVDLAAEVGGLNGINTELQRQVDALREELAGVRAGVAQVAIALERVEVTLEDGRTAVLSR